MNLLARIKNMAPNAPSEDSKFISEREADEALLGKMAPPATPNGGDFYDRIGANKKLVPSVFQLDEDNILTDAEKQYLSFTERHGYMGHEPSVLACLQQFRATKDKAQLYRALSVIHHLLDIS